MVDQFPAELTCEHPERLRLFADRVFEECQDRIRYEPWCLPVKGAVATGKEVIIRGLIYSPGATREYASECLAELMVQLFAERKPEYGAIVVRALSEQDGAELLVVVTMEGATGHAASDARVLGVAAPDLRERDRRDRWHQATRVSHGQDLADALVAPLVGDQCAGVERQAGHSAARRARTSVGTAPNCASSSARSSRPRAT